MLKREQKFHTRLMKWLQYNKRLFPDSFLIETKVVRPPAKSFPLSELSDKERRLLRQAKYLGLLQTHSDFGGLGTNCDASCIMGGGFVFINFYPSKHFYCIDIVDLLHYEEVHNIKSLSEKLCREIMFLEGDVI